jgi:hypothetical protein
MLEEAGAYPFIVFGVKTFPSNKELITLTMWARVKDTFDFMFLEPIWCKDRSWVSMFLQGEPHRVVQEVEFEFGGVVCGEITMASG